MKIAKNLFILAIILFFIIVVNILFFWLIKIF